MVTAIIILSVLSLAAFAVALSLLKENSSLKENLNAYKNRETELITKQQGLEKLLAMQQESFGKLQNAAEDKFKQLADGILKTKVNELKENNKENLSPLITPLNENLSRLQDKLAVMKTLNEGLQKEANNLANALQFNKTQGDLGEMLLEQVLQSCGLTKDIHYQMQPSYKTEDGKTLRPDCVINMPDKRYIVIDSKMSLTAYKNFVNEKNPEKKELYLKEHIASIVSHIKELSAKKYQDLKKLKGNNPDFVLMFVPFEYAYISALQAQPDLGFMASGYKIAVVTANSLLPVLKTVNSVWTVAKVTANIEEIIKTANQICESSARFSTNMNKLGNSLQSAQESFADVMTNMNGQQGILHYAKKLSDLGIEQNKIKK